MKKYYLTTPIYYVNDKPHIGTAYTTLAADVLARFHRLNDEEVKFLTGTDEHGQKVEQSALKAGIDPQIFTDQVAANFENLFKEMNISNDYFIRTTEAKHKEAVVKLWKQLEDSGNIYLGSYSGWYAVRDECFYKESELINGLAPTGAAVEWVEEPSYFFALSKWQDKLLEFYEADPNFVKPASRYNEVISFVRSGLNDLSISRTSIKWGIPVPGNNEHVIYVWLDALTNYLAAVGYGNNDDEYQKFWPADVHIVGKDILRFHAIYWPTFLMAAKLPLPKCVFAHGWWTNEGQKISKSLGNTIDPKDLMEEFGLDAVRYFLIREVNFGNDGNFSRSALINRTNSELVNKIGNLLQRTLTLVSKNNHGKIPDLTDEELEIACNIPLIDLAYKNGHLIPDLINNFEINQVIDLIIEIADAANLYIDQEAPWNLAKQDHEKMLSVLYSIIEAIRCITICLQPFIPSSAGLMLEQIGAPLDQRTLKHLNKSFRLPGNSDIQTPSIIFPRIKV